MLGVVLAAGKGERMRPLSAERPKALLPTLDVPQLTWALARLKAAGVRRAWVNARKAGGDPGNGWAPGGEASVVGEAERAAAVLDLDVRVSFEPEEPLGTSGALAKLRAELDETFLLVNADVAASLPLERLVAAHRAAEAPASLVGIPTRDRADFVAEEGRVVQLVDRSRRAGAGHVYAGMGVFEPSVLDYVPDGVSHLFDTVMLGLLRDAGTRGLAMLEWNGFWSDLADPAAYLRVNLDALHGALAAGPDGVPGGSTDGSARRWDERAYVGPGAEVDDLELVDVVVGAGARLEPGTRLERCVVWDGAVIERGAYADSVLTRRGVVKVAETAGWSGGAAQDGRRTS